MGLVPTHKLKRPHPYLIATGAVAASAAALLQGGNADAFHVPGEWYEVGVYPAAGNGKMYSDKEPGRPCYGLAEPALSVCYMTINVDRSVGAEDSAWSNGIDGGSAKWNATDTTIFFQAVPFNMQANDVHVKTADLNYAGPDTRAMTEFLDYHGYGYNPLCVHGDCNDWDGIASHQPQRWWYNIIWLDTSDPDGGFLGESPGRQQTIFAHELAHALGLEERPIGCQYWSIQDVSCVVIYGLSDPSVLDTCSVNHAGWPVSPLMYGDAFDSQAEHCVPNLSIEES